MTPLSSFLRRQESIRTRKMDPCLRRGDGVNQTFSEAVNARATMKRLSYSCADPLGR
jgi:hypothetical protein